MRIGYLVGRYPAVSHAFLEREVRGLREAGVEVETISVRTPAEGELLSERDRQEADRTFYVLPVGPARLLAAHAGVLARQPIRYLATLIRSLRLAQPGFRARLRGLAYFAEAIVVRRHCASRKITHLHATQFADGAGTVALLAAHLARDGRRDWTWSLTVHGPAEFYDVSRYRLAEKVRRASFTTAVSEFTRSQLMALVEEWHWSRILVVHMGVDLERYRPRERPLRREGDVRVLVVGRLVRHKGHALLLDALARLRDEGLILQLTIAGEGEERQTLAEIAAALGIEGQVRILGAVGQDELPDLYGEADVFCLPTLAEAVGVVNMEAMATGLPVVSSRLAGIPELVEDGVSGLLVDPGNVGQLADALRTLAGDPAMRRRMGEAGQRKVEAEFDAAREAAKLRRALVDYT
jgi:colanic acid/amylovoran biosynthesis glycosyltransferase